MKFTDSKKPDTLQIRSSRPSCIVISHSCNILNSFDDTDNLRFDTIKPSFTDWSKYIRKELKSRQFLSHYFIEQIGTEIVTIVGTGETLVSKLMYETVGHNDSTILSILVAGDFSMEFPPEDCYREIGMKVDDLMRKYKLKFSDVLIFEEYLSKKSLKPHKSFRPMKFFEKKKLRDFIKNS